MEGKKTYQSCVDPGLEVLTRLEIDDDGLTQNPDFKNPIKTLQLDLRFFKMFFWGFEFGDETDNDLGLHAVVRTMSNELRQTVMEYCELATKSLHASSHFVGKFKAFKSQARKCCIDLLGGTFNCKSFNNLSPSVYARDTDDFLGFILDNLELLNLKLDLIAALMQPILFILGKLKLFKNFVHFVSKLKMETIGEMHHEVLFHTRIWANHTSCLLCLVWIDGMDEKQAFTTAALLSDLMQKTMPYTPEVMMLYFDMFTETRHDSFETEEIRQLIQRFVDFLVEDLNGIEILREGLIFLLTFLTEPPPLEDLKDEKLILKQIDAVISMAPFVISSIRVDETTECTSMPKTIRSEFLQEIDRIKAKVRQFFVSAPHLSESNFPRTNAIAFLDFLLGNLKKMLEMEVNFIAFVKHWFQRVWEELSLLRPIMQNIMELQDENEAIKNIRTRIISVVYHTDYVIKLSSLTCVPGWASIIFLSDIIRDIKLIETAAREVQDRQVYKKNNKLIDEIESSDSLLPRATTSTIEGSFIGFKEDARSIVDQLVRGRKHLTIISISGMPGQGKTTLAKRIYNDPEIQYHFHEILWCYVSKKCKIRELLMGIVRDVNKVDIVKIVNLEIHDLAERLWKSLKGKRYMIVMDDIWDVDVWHQVQVSLPDDCNGSRILFTSRNHTLVAEAKPDSISHPLRLFTDEESWELMEENLFSGSSWAPEFLEIGKQIAIYCKGLPLAVVLIAALLGRTEPKLELWNKVVENLKSHLGREGCMHIIELSYKYLPDPLKSCFLYFAAFPRGKYIRAKKLKLLWIAEGFIEENEMQCSEDLAKEYLDSLVCQSLVAVTERNSMGGIKTCNVHDLLYDLCLEKAVEESFLHLADTNTIVHQHYFRLLRPQEYNSHRICLGTDSPFTHLMPICTRPEKPCSPVHSILLSSVYSFQGAHSFTHLLPKFLSNFQLLCILDMEDLRLSVGMIPEEIMSIVHLRYLSVVVSYMKSISPSISGLWNLQTLIVRRPKFEVQGPVELPGTMLNMRSLRHINIHGCRFYFEGADQNGCHPYFEDLETLSAPILDCDHKNESFLRSLPRLRRLYCCFGEEFHPTWFLMFASLNRLTSLRIDFVGCYSSPDNSHVSFPGFNFPENLKKLTLSEFKLPWNVMSTIAKMPNLEVLKLLRRACEGTNWDLEDGDFPKLRYLKLCQLKLETLNASSESFCCLQELHVDRCKRLEEIPSSFGDICSLKIIKLFWSDKASESVRQILELQRSMGNDSLQAHITLRTTE